MNTLTTEELTLLSLGLRFLVDLPGPSELLMAVETPACSSLLCHVAS